MPKQICPRCGYQYEDEGWKSVCGKGDRGECVGEIEWSDPQTIEAWKGLKLLLNTRIGEDQWKDMADSAGATKLMDMWLEVKDLDTRRNWVLRWAKKIIE